VSYLQRDLNSGSKTYYKIGSGNSFYGMPPWFYSREWPSQAYQPKLVVTYTPPSFPDFIVQLVSLSNTTPSEGENVTATVVVKNQGSVAGDAGYLDIWYDKPSAASVGDDGDWWADVGVLGAGEGKAYEHTFTASGSGTKTFRAFIDSQDDTSESNENNNQSTKTYTVVSPSPEIEVRGNNVIITDGDTTPSTTDHTDFGTTSVGSPVSRTYTVKNIGTATLTTSGLSVPSGYTVTEGLSSSIPAGGQDAFTVRLNANAAGTYSGDVSFSNNDSNENPFNFRITGAVGGGGSAQRTISGTYVTVMVTPLASTSSYAVEEVLPAGLTPQNINNSGSWDSVNRKVKWGPYFDATPRTFTYTVTGPNGVYTITGTASFNGSGQSTTGDSTVTLPSVQYHPADTDQNWILGINEVTAYGAAWKQGQHQNINYVTRAGYLWKNGEKYRDTGSGALNPDADAARWAAGASPNAMPLKSMGYPILNAGVSTAVRSVANDASSSPDISVTVTPDSTVSSYAVEELLPAGLTPQNINNSGSWDSANRKVKWGPFFDTTARTFSYEVTGANGPYQINGTASFDGVGRAITGTAQINIGTPSAPKLAVTPASRSVTKDAGSTTFSVANTGSGTMNWTAAVTVGGTWARITSGASGSNAGTITVGFDANPAGGVQRTATIRVTALGATGSPVDVTVVQAANPVGSPAVRTVSGTTVMIAVTPPTSTSSYAVEEVLPVGLTPQNINNSGNWDSANRKVKWGPYFDATTRTFSYEVTGANGTYSVNGTASFDGVGQAITGTAQVNIGTPSAPKLAVTPATRPVSKGAGSTTFSVANVGSGTMAWTAEVACAWARITSGASGGNTGTITVGFDANPAGGAQRTATIRVTAFGATGSPMNMNVTVVQAPNPGGGTGDDPDDAGYLCDPAGDATLMTIGSYDGYFYAAEAFGGAEKASAVRGTLSLKVTHLVGKLTAKAMLQGGNVSFKGEAAWRMADGTRRAELTASGGEKLDLFVRQNRIWGTLTGGRAGAATLILDGARNRFADRGDAEAAARLEEFKGYYTVALPAAEDGVDAVPQGVGYLTIRIGNKGSAKIAGVLADGTKVSRSSRLILFDGCGPEACVPLFVPLYMKKGWVGGLLWIDPETRTVGTDRDIGWFIRWENPGRVGPDGFSLSLDACGGFYGTGASLAAAYLFGAEVDDTAYFAAGEAQEWAVWPEGVPVTSSGSRLTIAKGAKPEKRSHPTYRDWVWYSYDEENPANATFSFASRTGIFKGKFSLYCDYEDASGKLIHKAVSVPYAGVLTPLRSEAFDDLPVGLGYCLVPDNDPAARALRIKRSRLVWLEEQ